MSDTRLPNQPLLNQRDIVVKKKRKKNWLESALVLLRKFRWALNESKLKKFIPKKPSKKSKKTSLCLTASKCGFCLLRIHELPICVGFERENLLKIRSFTQNQVGISRVRSYLASFVLISRCYLHPFSCQGSICITLGALLSSSNVARGGRRIDFERAISREPEMIRERELYI